MKKTTIIDMTPSEIEIQLALGVMTYYDRTRLARTTTSVEILELLSYDVHYAVRSYVAMNKYASIDMLNRLCYDEHQYVRHDAAITLTCKLNDEKRNSNSVSFRDFKS